MEKLFKSLQVLKARPLIELDPLTPNQLQSSHLTYTDTIYAFTGPSKTTLDNWAPATIEISNRNFKSTEHIIFAVAKAAMFNDTASHAIALTKTFEHPSVSKQFGRQIQNFNETVWRNNAEWISDVAILVKAVQNEEMRMELLKTGRRNICEASSWDSVWGIGLRADDPDVLDPKMWKGQNLLGKSLMRVREYLFEVLVRKGPIKPIVEEEKMQLFFQWFDNSEQLK
jgi:ribA/ribD-fused uncharacterized protein